MKEQTSNHLLYLDTRDLPIERDEEILAAVELGYGLIIATDRPDKYRYHQVEHLIETPLGNYDSAHRDITAYLEQRRISLAGVVSWKDREVELASRLAAHFRLPGNSLESVRRVRDKAETRKALARLNGVNPKYAVVSDKAEFDAAISEMTYPCLLKPAGNSGSRGIFRIPDSHSHHIYDDFRQYNARSTGDMFSYYADHALLEEEVSGSEHSIAGLIYEGRVYVTAIADKQFERDILMQYENIIPSALSDEVQASLVEAVTQALTVIGLTDGGFHADVIVDQNGKPYILELGGRLGGEMINSHLIPLAYGGLSTYRQLLNILTGQKPSLSETTYRAPSMRAGARIVRAPGVGTIKQISGLQSVTKHPAVRAVMQMKGPHDAIYKPRDKFKEYEVVYIIAQCSLDEDMSELLRSLENLLGIEMYAEHDSP